MKWRNSKERELLSSSGGNKDAQEGEVADTAAEILRHNTDSDADESYDMTMTSRKERLESFEESVSDSEYDRTSVTYAGQAPVSGVDVMDYHDDVNDSFSESDEEIHVS